MTSVGNVFEYYWRVFSNTSAQTGGLVGYFHLISFAGVLTMIFVLTLSVLVFRAQPSAAKNRFMALMLLSEGVTAGMVGIWWLFPWPVNAMSYLYSTRLVIGTTSMMRILLFLTAPAFYTDHPWANRVKKVYESGAIFLMIPLGFLMIYGCIELSGGMKSGLGDLATIVCAEVGPGRGTTYFGDPLPFDPYCPERLAPFYPMTYTSLGTGQIIVPLVLIQAAVMIYATTAIVWIVIRQSTKQTMDLVELKSVRLGFVTKTILTLAGTFAFVGVSMLFGAPSPDRTIFNEEWMNDEGANIFFALAPMLITLHIVAAFIEGVVLTYAVVKHEVMGIDERLRKTFTATLFAGTGGLLLLVGSELMENLIGIGWIGGVLIGIVLFAIRTPALKLLSVFSVWLLPEAFTKEESGYIQLYRLAMEDGIITPKERSMLQMQAKAYGIGPQRTQLLEETVNAALAQSNA